jgi:hypothetical protein
MKNPANTSNESFLHRGIRFCASVLIASAFVVCAPGAQAQAPVPNSPAIEAKAHEMLTKLTLEREHAAQGRFDAELSCSLVPDVRRSIQLY